MALQLSDAPDLPEAQPGTVSVEDIARPFLAMLHDMTELDTVFLTRIDWEAGEQKVLYAVSGDGLAVPEGASLPWSESICRRAMMGGPNNTADVPTDYPGNPIAAAFGVKTYVTYPIVTPDPDGTVYGTICGASVKSVVVDEKTVTMIKHVAGLIGERVARERDLERATRSAARAAAERDHIANLAGELAQAVEQRDHAARTFEKKSEELKRLNSELADMAVTDALTGVHNRRGFQQRWEQELASARRHQYPVTITLIDLDGFKEVNDSQGHSAGDAVICAIAGILKAHTRDNDILARLGGDEFVLALSHADALEAKRVCKRMRQALSEMVLEGIIGPRGFSAGIASTASTPAHQLLEAADRALYRAKAAGGMRAEVYFGELS
ncbi:MAG: sensor domain-containing diguanylate cyclase [Candidatus Dormibacteria bacterium]